MQGAGREGTGPGQNRRANSGPAGCPPLPATARTPTGRARAGPPATPVWVTTCPLPPPRTLTPTLPWPPRGSRRPQEARALTPRCEARWPGRRRGQRGMSLGSWRPESYRGRGGSPGKAHNARKVSGRAGRPPPRKAAGPACGPMRDSGPVRGSQPALPAPWWGGRASWDTGLEGGPTRSRGTGRGRGCGPQASRRVRSPAVTVEGPPHP